MQTTHKYLKTSDCKLRNQFDDFCVVINFDEFTKLIVGLESSQQTTELVVVACV